MPKTQPISLRLAPETNARLAALAAQLDRPKSWLIEQAVKDYLALQAWQLDAIEEGIAAADAGQLTPHDQVVAMVEHWGEAPAK